jgi:CxxC motif-containing protein (DUF1111 family)
MRRTLIAVVFSFYACVLVLACADGGFRAPGISDSDLAGGQTTVHNTSRDAFAKPANNLPTKDLRTFTFGNKMFNTNWVTAPASVQTLDGLGPLFNRVSCAACHFKDGRGHAPADEAEPRSMLVRLSVPGTDDHGGPAPDPVYGGQINDLAIRGVKAEARVRVSYREIKGVYDDGTPYALRVPELRLEKLGYGPLGEGVMLSPRVASAVFGMGLLAAVPERTILSAADPEDRDGDGISGRPNYVWDEPAQATLLGRFGWKANVASLLHQDASAALGDIGITTRLFPRQSCERAQAACAAAPTGGESGAPEMSDMQLEKMTFYLSTLAVPARRAVSDPPVLRGGALFVKAQCAACHTPQMKTGAADIPALAYQDIQPFTDLLLHDMGPGLADGRPDYLANGAEWRTAPLWGLGLVHTVNRHTNFLHDGRARNAAEAILWHGGEAERSRAAFVAMSAAERADLLAFLNSL